MLNILNLNNTGNKNLIEIKKLQDLLLDKINLFKNTKDIGEQKRVEQFEIDMNNLFWGLNFVFLSTENNELLEQYKSYLIKYLKKDFNNSTAPISVSKIIFDIKEDMKNLLISFNGGEFKISEEYYPIAYFLLQNNKIFRNILISDLNDDLKKFLSDKNRENILELLEQKLSNKIDFIEKFLSFIKNDPEMNVFYKDLSVLKNVFEKDYDISNFGLFLKERIATLIIYFIDTGKFIDFFNHLGISLDKQTTKIINNQKIINTKKKENKNNKKDTLDIIDLNLTSNSSGMKPINKILFNLDRLLESVQEEKDFFEDSEKVIKFFEQIKILKIYMENTLKTAQELSVSQEEKDKFYKFILYIKELIEGNKLSFVSKKYLYHLLTPEISIFCDRIFGDTYKGWNLLSPLLKQINSETEKHKEFLRNDNNLNIILDKWIKHYFARQEKVEGRIIELEISKYKEYIKKILDVYLLNFHKLYIPNVDFNEIQQLFEIGEKYKEILENQEKKTTKDVITKTNGFLLMILRIKKLGRNSPRA